MAPSLAAPSASTFARHPCPRRRKCVSWRFSAGQTYQERKLLKDAAKAQADRNPQCGEIMDGQLAAPLSPAGKSGKFYLSPRLENPPRRESYSRRAFRVNKRLRTPSAYHAQYVM